MNGSYLLGSETGFIVGEAGSKDHRSQGDMVATRIGDNHNLAWCLSFDPDEGVAVGEQGLILRTTDGGAAWQSVASGVTDKLQSVPFSGVNGICGGDSQTILYSTDWGASCQIGQTGFFGGGLPGASMLSATTGRLELVRARSRGEMLPV